MKLLENEMREHLSLPMINSHVQLFQFVSARAVWLIIYLSTRGQEKYVCVCVCVLCAQERKTATHE